MTTAECQRSRVILRRRPVVVSFARRSVPTHHAKRSTSVSTVISRTRPIIAHRSTRGSSQIARIAMVSSMPSSTNTVPLSVTSAKCLTEFEIRLTRATSPPTPVRGNVMTTPQATTASSPEMPTCSDSR